MTIIDPATCARLADALEGATPEDISTFARIALDRAMSYRSNEGQRIYLTLAALALAVAEGHHLFLDHCGASHDLTLPSALAALLRTSETTR